ncbi:MAG: hypothetical protein S0880_13945 [Actinomycetota bacterium]|nr:hypothetical protein [Actinomycetota bacterium]
MRSDTIDRETLPPNDDDRRDGRRDPTALVMVIVIPIVGAFIALGLAMLARDDPADDGSVVAATTTSAAPSTTEAPATTAPSTPDTTGVPTTPSVPATTVAPTGPTAAEQLEPFFAGAAAVDAELRAAARAINASGPPWDVATEEAANHVRAADVDAVAATLPAGMPDDLMAAAILVYSDLASRRAAMQDFANAGEISFDRDPLSALANGHAAAERFADDLAAAEALAASTPAFDLPGPGSQATAELLLTIDYVNLANRGCDSRGGGVITELPPIEWTSDTGGLIGGPGIEAIEFVAEPHAGGQWTTYIVAC